MSLTFGEGDYERNSCDKNDVAKIDWLYLIYFIRRWHVRQVQNIRF